MECGLQGICERRGMVGHAGGPYWHCYRYCFQRRRDVPSTPRFELTALGARRRSSIEPCGSSTGTSTHSTPRARSTSASLNCTAMVSPTGATSESGPPNSPQTEVERMSSRPTRHVACRRSQSAQPAQRSCARETDTPRRTVPRRQQPLCARRGGTASFECRRRTGDTYRRHSDRGESRDASKRSLFRSVTLIPGAAAPHLAARGVPASRTWGSR